MSTEPNTVAVTADNFDAEVLRSSEPVLIDFWATWCGPCRAIAPVLDQLAAEYAGRVRVAKVNVDEERELAQAFEVRAIPVLFALVDGEVVDKMVGFNGKKQLEQAFANLANIKSAAAAAAQ